MASKIEKVILNGKRVRDLMIENDMSNEDLRKLWSYGNIKNVSEYISKKRTPIAIDRAEALANRFNVRLQYLCGDDDFRTEEEMISQMSIQDRDAFTKSKEYLETIGFSLKPTILLTADTWFYRDNIDLLEPYIYPADWKRLKESYDFTLSKSDFHKRYKRNFEKVEITKFLDPDKIKIDFKEVGKQHNESFVWDKTVNNGATIFKKENDIMSHHYYDFGFKAYYDGVYKYSISISDVESIMSEIDSVVRFTLDNILSFKHANIKPFEYKP